MKKEKKKENEKETHLELAIINCYFIIFYIVVMACCDVCFISLMLFVNVTVMFLDM